MNRLACAYSCRSTVTHIGEKGFVYCAEHAAHRRGHEHCRRLRVWEVQRMESGKPLMSYRPMSKSASDAMERALYGVQS